MLCEGQTVEDRVFVKIDRDRVEDGVGVTIVVFVERETLEDELAIACAVYDSLYALV